jgi:diguanylate cyclase (GGDEF)-like protein
MRNVQSPRAVRRSDGEMSRQHILPAATDLAPGARRVVRALAAVMVAILAAHLSYTSTGIGGDFAEAAINRWGANVVYAAAVALCALRVRWGGESRGAWLAIAVGLGLYGAGNLYYSAVLYSLESPPFPSPADAGWLAFYPAAYASLGLIARDSARRFPVRVWLDGLLVALAVAGVGVTAVVVPVFGGLSGSAGAVITNAAYPVGDLLLLSLTIGFVALNGWRGRVLFVLAAGIVIFAVADSVYMYRLLEGTFHPGTVLDSLWLVGAVVVSLAAWQRPQRTEVAAPGGGATLVMPLGFGLLALALLTVAGVRPVQPVAVGLAAAAVAIAVLRTALSFREVRAFAETHRQATTDDLTGLPNRRAFDRSLEAAIECRRGRGQTLAVMLIDLDHFKDVNDTLGHHAGDRVLEQVGPRLRAALRHEDRLARLGGDEFAVLFNSAEAAAAAGPRIASALGHRFSIEGIEIQVAASLGVALYPEHGTDAETLKQRADVAMYDAKQRRTGLEIYARERDRNTRERLQLIADLRAAVQARDLVLHYQPKIDLRSGQVTGGEALLRWRHPIRGPIAPNEFIPLAEQTGLIHPLTEIVLDEAVRQAAAWHAEGHKLDVAINMSTTSLLDRDWVDAVTSALGEHGLPARHLILEITEDTIMADPERSLSAAQALTRAGIRVALDDFGTGHSSLAYLKNLPISELKIDRCFVRDLATDPADAAIVEGIVAICQRLDIAVVAEGVEDEDAVQQLLAFGTDGAQGFHFSPALPPDQFISWLRDRLTVAVTLNVGKQDMKGPSREALMPSSTRGTPRTPTHPDDTRGGMKASVGCRSVEALRARPRRAAIGAWKVSVRARGGRPACRAASPLGCAGAARLGNDAEAEQLELQPAGTLE